MLAQGSSGADSELLIGRAKAYYFSSYVCSGCSVYWYYPSNPYMHSCSVSGKTINWDEYAAYKSGALDSSSTPAHSIVDNAQSPRGDKDPSDPGSGALSFAQITALIESGQTDKIPNNDIIPQGLNVKTFLCLTPFSLMVDFHRMQIPASRRRNQGRSHGRVSMLKTIRDHLIQLQLQVHAL